MIISSELSCQVRVSNGSQSQPVALTLACGVAGWCPADNQVKTIIATLLQGDSFSR